jgi:hypothetical protein
MIQNTAFIQLLYTIEQCRTFGNILLVSGALGSGDQPQPTYSTRTEATADATDP